MYTHTRIYMHSEKDSDRDQQMRSQQVNWLQVLIISITHFHDSTKISVA